VDSTSYSYRIRRLNNSICVLSSISKIITGKAKGGMAMAVPAVPVATALQHSTSWSDVVDTSYTNAFL